MEIDDVLNLCDTFAQKSMATTLTEYEMLMYEQLCVFLQKYFQVQTQNIAKDLENVDSEAEG